MLNWFVPINSRCSSYTTQENKGDESSILAQFDQLQRSHQELLRASNQDACTLRIQAQELINLRSLNEQLQQSKSAEGYSSLFIPIVDTGTEISNADQLQHLLAEKQVCQLFP